MRLRITQMILPVTLCCPHMLAAQQVSASPQLDTSAAVITWLRQAAIPLRHVEAGNGFADLQPLKQIWKDVRFVGLGEITHGTREFIQVKHRLLEFLVREMGFTAIAIEDSYANSQPINEYVLHGRGDRASVLTGQGWIVWDNEEMAALIDWMRAYNASVPDERKVRYHGVDVLWNDVGQARVLAFLRKAAPDRVQSTDSLFQAFAREEARRPVDDTTALASLQARLERLESYLSESKNVLVARSSPSEWESALQHVRVMLRAVSPDGRTPGMADNLKYIIEHERPGTKFVLWAHDTHLQVKPGTSRNIGQYVRQTYGDQYYAVATAFNQGSYQTRLRLPGQPAGDLKELVAPPAPTRSLPWYLARAGVGNLFLDLRTLPADPVIQQWASTPLTQHGSGWFNHDITKTYRPVNFKELFDGIIYIEKSTPTRPTPNARKNVANRVRI